MAGTVDGGGALAGIKVLDLATLFPAPLLAAMLGDLGADVVKVEGPAGDPIRRVGALDGGEPRAHRYANRNKRSIVVDPASPDGLDLLAALTAVADVVVVNQTDARLRAWRCSYDEIAARNPGAVVASLTAFGRSGPWANRGGNGSIAEAFGGFAYLNGEAGGPPTLPSLALGDTLGAIVALNGVLAALVWRASPEGQGRGQLVDASLAESVLTLLGATFAGWNPGEPVPERLGSRIATATPRNVYRTADNRYMVVSAPTDAEVARVLTLIGVTDDASRARFATAGAARARSPTSSTSGSPAGSARGRSTTRSRRSTRRACRARRCKTSTTCSRTNSSSRETASSPSPIATARVCPRRTRSSRARRVRSAVPGAATLAPTLPACSSPGLPAGPEPPAAGVRYSSP